MVRTKKELPTQNYRRVNFVRPKNIRKVKLKKKEISEKLKKDLLRYYGFKVVGD
jgi:hypothetical protein